MAAPPLRGAGREFPWWLAAACGLGLWLLVSILLDPVYGQILAAKMTAASGQAKVDATAAVVSEIVAQRKAMREGGPQSMATCPMMKMGGMKH